MFNHISNTLEADRNTPLPSYFPPSSRCLCMWCMWYNTKLLIVSWTKNYRKLIFTRSYFSGNLFYQPHHWSETLQELLDLFGPFFDAIFDVVLNLAYGICCETWRKIPPRIPNLPCRHFPDPRNKQTLWITTNTVLLHLWDVFYGGQKKMKLQTRECTQVPVN